MQETQPTSERVRIVEKDGYSVDLEYNKEFAIVHLPYVKEMNKGTFRDMVETLPSFQKFLKVLGYQTLYAAVFSEDKATKKLVLNLGFTYSVSEQGFDIYELTSEED